MVWDPAPSRTSPGLWWDGLHVLLFCHWFSKALREGGRVFGPSDSLSRDWFRLWSEARRQMFWWDGFWMGACPLSKGKSQSPQRDGESIPCRIRHDQQGTGFQSENKKRQQPNPFETCRKIRSFDNNTIHRHQRHWTKCRKFEEMEPLIHCTNLKPL